MNLLTIVVAFACSLFLTILTLRIRKPGDRFIILLIYYLLLFLAVLVVGSQLLGFPWHSYVQIGAFMYVTVFWMRQIWVASFWGKLFYQTLLVVHLSIAGYLYAVTQMPYPDRPFAQLSMNAPLPLAQGQYPDRQISGLPQSADPPRPLPEAPAVVPAKSAVHASIPSLSWESIESLMQKDSHIRAVMQQLKEEQERELSDHLANLNAESVASTQVRRHALTPAQINDLLQEQAISTTRYHTMLETWRLLDSDEQAFRTPGGNALPYSAGIARRQ